MEKDKDKLFILWTNADVMTADKMVMMYALNSKLKNWWKEVTIIVWGSTVKLSAENELIQEKIKQALHAGIKVLACKACADQFGVTEILTSMGISVEPVSEYFTTILKDGETLLTI